jgi:hypothetical protein
MALKPRLTEDARPAGHVSHDAQVRVDKRVQKILARREHARLATRTSATPRRLPRPSVRIDWSYVTPAASRSWPAPRTPMKARSVERSLGRRGRRRRDPAIGSSAVTRKARTKD